MIKVLIASANSECSSERAQMRRLARAFATRIYKEMDVNKDWTKILTPSPAGYINIGVYLGFCAYAIGTKTHVLAHFIYLMHIVQHGYINEI